jgi:1-acyl-sn-glycerol-3-phosphate acyltransferase
VAHGPVALRRARPVPVRAARARRRSARALASTPADLRAVHRRPALRAQARVHDLAVGRWPGTDKDGISPGITPDGPRGPRFRFKPGAIFTAQISRKPVVPLAFAAKPAWILRTWDKFVIPSPFARIVIAIGEPYFPPRKLDEAGMEAAQRELEQRMLQTYQQAKAAL